MEAETSGMCSSFALCPFLCGHCCSIRLHGCSSKRQQQCLAAYYITPPYGRAAAKSCEREDAPRQP